MADENNFPSLDEVVAGGAQAGYSPDQQATAVLKWRDLARETAQKADLPADQFFKGNAALDGQVNAKLADLQKQQVSDWAIKTFGHDQEGWQQFKAAYKQDPAAAYQLDPKATDELNGIYNNPAFRPIPQVNQYAPLRVGNQQVGTYAVQQGTHGNLDVMLMVQPEKGGDFKRSVLSVPMVTEGDVKAEQSKVKADVDKWTNVLDLQETGGEQGLEPGTNTDEATLPTRKKLVEASQRLQQLQGVGGFASLQSERIDKAFNESPDAQTFKHWGLGQDLVRGATGMLLELNAARASLIGSEQSMKDAREALAGLPDVLPGTTREGGFARFAKGGAEMLGQLPMLALPGGMTVLGASSYGGTKATALDAADAAQAQADRLKTLNPELADQLSTLSGQMRRDADVHGALSGATLMLGMKVIPEAKSLLGQAARGGAEWAGITAGQQALGAQFEGRDVDPTQILDGVLFGTVGGLAHGVLGKKAPAEAQAEAPPETPPTAPVGQQLLVKGRPPKNAPETPAAASAPPDLQSGAVRAAAPAAPAPVAATTTGTATAPLPPEPASQIREPRRETLPVATTAKNVAIQSGDAGAAEILQTVEQASAQPKPIETISREEEQKQQSQNEADQNRVDGVNVNPPEAQVTPAPANEQPAPPAEPSQAEPGAAQPLTPEQNRGSETLRMASDYASKTGSNEPIFVTHPNDTKNGIHPPHAEIVKRRDAELNSIGFRLAYERGRYVYKAPHEAWEIPIEKIKTEQPSTPPSNAPEVQRQESQIGEGSPVPSVQGNSPVGTPTPEAPERTPQRASEDQAQPQAQGAVDLFGNPVVEPPPATTAFDLGAVPVVEFPIDRLKLSKDVPNFKGNASPETGVVEGQQLQGRYERRGTAPVVAWERLNGDTEIITGRHRFDLAKRTGEKTIPTQILRESEGFTRDMALTFDAEANIRDGQGEVSDYAQYFKHRNISEEEATQRGLLSRAKGRAGWSLAKAATDDLYTLWQNGRISDQQAVAIADAAPGDPAAQMIGMRFALDGEKPDFLVNVMRASKLGAEEQGQTLDLFGFDDSAMNQMAAQAERASKFQKDISEQVRAVQGAAKRPETARKLGVDVKDPEAINRKVAELKAELQRWQNWPMYPDLVAKTRDESVPVAGKKGGGQRAAGPSDAKVKQALEEIRRGETAPPPAPPAQPPSKPPEPPAPKEPPAAGVPPDPATQIRLAHADEAARRIAEGKEVIQNTPQGTVEDWQTLAEHRVRAGEGAALVNDLIEKKRVATPVEDYMMKFYAENLERARSAADATLANPDATEAEKANAAQNKTQADQERERLALAANLAGSAWGAAGNARGRAMERDQIPTFPKMLADLMVAKGKAQGRPFLDLTPEEREMLENRYARIAKLKAEMDAREANAAADAERQSNNQLLADVQKELAETKAELEKLQARGGHRPRFTKKIVDAISEKADAARERLKSRGVTFNTGIDPTLLPDYAIIMAEYIAKGVDATAEMIGKFGAGIKDSLKDIERMAKGLLAKEITPKTLDEIKQELKDRKENDPEATIGKHFANELAKAHLRDAMASGADMTANDLNKAVHNDLKEFVPDITLKEATDLRTGRGVKRYPSDNPVNVKLAELNRQSQLMMSIEDAELYPITKEPPPKTGFQRPKPSADVRELTKKLKDVMEKNGVETSSPEAQLATRREVIRSRLTNQIEDLDNVIAGKAKERQARPGFDYNDPKNADLKELKDHRDALQKIVDSMPENVEASEKAKNDAALKAAQDAEKEWNRRADELQRRGDLSGETTDQRAERSQEVKDARKKADEARARYQDLKKKADVNRPFTELSDIARKVDAAEKRIKEMEGKLSRGDLSVDTPTEKPSHPLLDEKRAKVDELNKRLQKLRDDAERPAREAERLQNEVNNLNETIADLQNKLATNDLSKGAKPKPRATTPLIDKLRKDRDALQKELDKKRRTAKSEAEKPAREAKRAAKELADAQRAVADLEAKIARGDLSVKTRPAGTIPDELKAERERLKELNKQLAKARAAAKPKMSEQEKALKAFKDRTLKKIGDLRQKRLAEIYESQKRKPKEFQMDKEAEQLQVAINKELEGIQQDKLKYERDARTNFRRTMDFIVHWAREFKLMHPSTIEKLTGAGLENILTRPIGTALAQLMRPFPVLRDIQRKATYEGRASIRSELKGLQGTFTSAKAVWQKATKGKSDIDWLNKKKSYSEEDRSYAGQIHGAIKEPVRQGIYSRSLQLELEAAEETFQKTGDPNFDPSQNKLLFQALTARAYENANMDILMGDNFLTKGIRTMLSSFRTNKIDPDAGKLLADVFEILMPIINVPTNIFIRVSRFNPLIGLTDAARRIVRASKKGELANGAEKLSANEADAITRSFKYGVFGVALAAYAWNNPQYFGGYWTPGTRKRKDTDLSFGDIKTPLFTINHHFAHGPVGTWLNIVADSRRKYDEFLKKNPGQSGEAGVSAAMFSMLAPVSRLPFIDTFLRFFDASKSPAQHLAEVARGSFLPADTDIAQFFDKDASGKPIQRRATTPLQEIELGIPGLRQNVPESKGKKQRNTYNPLR